MSNCRLKFEVVASKGCAVKTDVGFTLTGGGSLVLYASLPGDTPDSCIKPIVEAEVDQALQDLTDATNVNFITDGTPIADRIVATLPLLLWTPVTCCGDRMAEMTLAHDWRLEDTYLDEDDYEDDDFEDNDEDD